MKPELLRWFWSGTAAGWGSEKLANCLVAWPTLRSRKWSRAQKKKTAGASSNLNSISSWTNVESEDLTPFFPAGERWVEPSCAFGSRRGGWSRKITHQNQRHTALSLSLARLPGSTDSKPTRRSYFTSSTPRHGLPEDSRILKPCPHRTLTSCAGMTTVITTRISCGGKTHWHMFLIRHYSNVRCSSWASNSQRLKYSWTHHYHSTNHRGRIGRGHSRGSIRAKRPHSNAHYTADYLGSTTRRHR